MALSVTQAASNSTGGTAVTITFGTTTVSGSLIVVICYQGVNSTSTLSISDSASQSGWTQAGTYVSVSGDRFAMFYRPNSAALTTVTATWSGSLSATIPGVAYEIAGAALSTPLDANASNPATSTQANGTHSSFNSGTLSTNNNNCVLLFGMGAGNNQVAEAGGSGYTTPTNWNTSNGRCAMSYKIVSTTQSSTSTVITYNAVSTQNVGIFAAFSDTNQGASFQPDEDFWLNPLAATPYSVLTSYQAMQSSSLLLMEQDLAGPLFGQPDENYWSIFVIQPSTPIINIFS